MHAEIAFFRLKSVFWLRIFSDLNIRTALFLPLDSCEGNFQARFQAIYRGPFDPEWYPNITSQMRDEVSPNTEVWGLVLSVCKVCLYAFF